MDLPLRVSRPQSASVTTMTEYILPSHSNAQGNLFGGQMMAWIDLCAAVCARRHAGNECVTVFVDRLHFLKPVRVGEVAQFCAKVTGTFRTSLEISVDVQGENPRTGVVWPCVQAYVTLVSIGEEGRPTPLAPLLLDSEALRRSQEEANLRKRLRLAPVTLPERPQAPSHEEHGVCGV